MGKCKYNSMQNTNKFLAPPWWIIYNYQPSPIYSKCNISDQLVFYNKMQHFRSIGFLQYVSDRKMLHFGFYYGQGKR